MTDFDCANKSQRAIIPAWIFAVSAGLAVPTYIIGRTALAVALVLMLLMLPFAAIKGSRWRALIDTIKTPLGLLVVLTLVAWLPNLVFSLDPGRSFQTSIRSFFMLSVGVFIWSTLKEQPSLLPIVSKTLIVSVICAVLVAMFSTFVDPGLFWFLHLKGWRDDILVSELKPFAALAPLIIPATLWAARQDDRIWRTLSHIGCLGMVVLVYLVSNRAAVAGLLGGAALVILAMVLRNSLKRALGVVLALLTIVIGTVVWLKFTRHIAPHAGDWPLPIWLIDFERQAIWLYTLDQFFTQPWFGFGINTINLAPGADAIIPATNDTHRIPGHPHNWFLEILAETGLVGIVPFVTVLGLAFISLFRSYRRTGQSGVLAAIAIAGGYWISGLFNFSFWAAWWQFSYILLTMICLADASANTSHGDENQ